MWHKVQSRRALLSAMMPARTRSSSMRGRPRRRPRTRFLVAAVTAALALMCQTRLPFVAPRQSAAALGAVSATLAQAPALASSGEYISFYDVRAPADLLKVELCPVANCPGLADVAPIEVFGVQISYKDAALVGAILSFGWKLGPMFLKPESKVS